MKRSARGQAVVEMAVVVPLMLAITFSFLGMIVWLETAHDLRAATTLASTTAATFADDSPAAASAEAETFFGTMRQYGYVEVSAFACRRVGTRVSCDAAATLRFDRTPLGMAWVANPTMRASSVSYASAYRSR